MSQSEEDRELYNADNRDEELRKAAEVPKEVAYGVVTTIFVILLIFCICYYARRARRRRQKAERVAQAMVAGKSGDIDLANPVPKNPSPSGSSGEQLELADLQNMNLKVPDNAPSSSVSSSSVSSPAAAPEASPDGASSSGQSVGSKLEESQPSLGSSAGPEGPSAGPSAVVRKRTPAAEYGVEDSDGQSQALVD